MMNYENLRQNQELWDLFTRKEEYSPKRLDKHDRFISSFNEDILEPKVSKYLIDQGLKVEFPENKKFAVCLTHDVDDIYPPFSHTLLSSLYCMKNLNISELRHQLTWKFKGKEFSPYRNFKEIMDLEDKYGAKSSFYFIATDKDIKRFRYNIEDLENELGYIVEKGCEVGLHGGYYAFNDLHEIKKEKMRLEKVLNRKVIGYRNHYLRFKIPDTWELLAKSGFKYDTSLGYPDNIGFRNGMCHPFRPYNLIKNNSIDILELPLNIMDGALFSSSNNIEAAWNKTKILIDNVKKNNGIMTILWHNNVFNYPLRYTWKKLYMKLLNYCNENYAWITSGENIVRWWKDVN